jgi:hypothetical protein
MRPKRYRFEIYIAFRWVSGRHLPANPAQFHELLSTVVGGPQVVKDPSRDNVICVVDARENMFMAGKDGKVSEFVCLRFWCGVKFEMKRFRPPDAVCDGVGVSRPCVEEQDHHI